MSNVTKCDVCGAIYGYDKEKDESRVRIFRSKHFYNPETDSSFDFCPNCTKKLLEFIDVLKSGNRYALYIMEDTNEQP